MSEEVPAADALELSAVAAHSRLAALAPDLDTMLEGMVKAVERRVLQDLDRMDLTEQAALAAWLEIAAIRRLGRRVRQKVSTGEALGEQYALKLESGHRE